MSRQYDEAHGDDIEINGETLHAIEPSAFEELLDAVRMKDKMAYAVNTIPNDEDPSNVYALLEEQEGYIREYIENLGNFDNSILVANIDYLCRKYNIRVGELERYAGISAGYISRTAKENSLKKMSIDVVWKIAKLFNVSVQDLIGNKLEEIKGNTALLMQFLDKLIRQTESGELSWENAGGVMCYLDERLTDLGLFEQTDSSCIYHPDHLNKKYKWVLTGDIMVTGEFMEEEQALMIVPFAREGSDEQQYDLIMLYDNTPSSVPDEEPAWEKVLYTHDDPFLRLAGRAEALYKMIQSMELDAHLSSDMRFMVKLYLSQKE